MNTSTTKHTNLTRPDHSVTWSQYLHRRVMRLLLQHDQSLFKGHFRTSYTQSSSPKLPLLQLYDTYLKLLLFRNELLDDILPRIRRQLSLQNNQLSTQEEAPTRGEIDWPRTLSRTLDETPDQPPLRFETNQQQRSILIPENLFVVAILLKYSETVKNILKKDLADEAFNTQERQQLIEIDEQLERELAAPYAYSLLPDAKNADLEQLAEQLSRSLPPGTSAYRDLFHWWEQFTTLHLGKIIDRHQLTLIGKRSDESNTWLYELWIVLELINLLNELHSITIEDIHIAGDQIRFRFTWNDRAFFFTYHRLPSQENIEAPGWKNVPATETTCTIEREHPSEVKPLATIIWREPPVIFTINYNSQDTNYSLPLQKMLGAMSIHEAQHGLLLTTALPNPPSGEYAIKVSRDPSIYTSGMSYNLQNPTIRLCKLLPDMELKTLQERLKALLTDLTSEQTLPERPEPACHGIILDRDTINAARFRPQTYNILCPKPHIGSGVFDLVNDKIHCLKDPRLCHIYGQAQLAPLVIRASTQDAMNQQSSEIRQQADETLQQAEKQGREEEAEHLRSHILLGVGRAVEQYVKLRGNTTTLEAYFEQWIFGDYWKKHPRCLHEETRNILLSGEYIWNEYIQTPTLQDWAAPAVQYCRALEAEIQRRIHDYYPRSKEHYPDVNMKGFDVPHESMTLGAMEFIHLYKGHNLQQADQKDRNKIRIAQHNWQLCQAIINHSHADSREFEAILLQMVQEDVSHKRNKLAHGKAIPNSIAQELRDAILGHKGKVGLLYRLAEHLDPKN